MNSSCTTRQGFVSRGPQKGAATIVSVMVLFLIMAILSAYANRSLIFEGRVASNYYRAELARHAAEAGMEWTIAQLNGIYADEACKPSASATTRFRDRFLDIDLTTGRIQSVSSGTLEQADCVRNSITGWDCVCPLSGPLPPRQLLLGSNEMQPRFELFFNRDLYPISTPGVISVFVTGCSESGVVACVINSKYARDASVGTSPVQFSVALVSALKSPPTTPLVVRGALAIGINGIGLHNSEPLSTGMLLTTGEALPVFSGIAADRLQSIPGTPGEKAMLGNDPTLNGADSPKVFGKYFGTSMANYRDQPAMRVINCPPGDCAASLQDAYNRGVRLAWVNGPLSILSNVNLGSLTSPMVIIGNGPVNLSGPMKIYGVLFSNGNLSWDNGSAMPSQLIGSLIVSGNMIATGTIDLWFQQTVINELRMRAGSFVRVPGTWWSSL